MRWCAFDSEFTPNRMDGRFKIWITKGLNTYLSFTHKGIFKSFESLQSDKVWKRMTFLRYLQVRNFNFNKNLKGKVGLGDPEFLEVFF